MAKNYYEKARGCGENSIPPEILEELEASKRGRVANINFADLIGIPVEEKQQESGKRG